jgi:hypothetical protein
MTFYSYEIINRSTYELRETYFSQWVDPDLGYAWDDFVGCDVRRGLGYCYNGKSSDTPSSGSYSGNPPAVGIDFFQGPYMDADGKDNPKINIPWIQTNGNDQLRSLLSKYRRPDGSYDTISISDDADLFYAIDFNSWYFVPGDAIGNCAINGVNFGNNIIDDERFGMRRFVYYDNGTSTVNGEPTKASDYYNYLRGYWKNGQRMKYGGNAISTGTTTLDCDFMFPYDSDPWHWGTDGQVPETNPMDWNEIAAGNSPGDRRFMQSAGPFTLKPGALNYITVGIPFAQASSGGEWESVKLLREIDDVCQALFENCFKVLDGPDAPTLTCQELNNEVILYINYDNPESNNYNEKYKEVDPAIVRSYTDPSTLKTVPLDDEARSFKFEGYQIYQLKDANVSVADLNDGTKARLVAQCDIENYYDTLLITPITNADDEVTGYDTSVNTSPSLPIGTLVNYTTNTATGILSGQVMVSGANKGIQHVFRVTTDQFATGTNTKLVNNKEYYFIAIAYAQNRYREYSQTDPNLLDGQKEPYLAGRKNERGLSISPITAVPHNPAVEDGGKIAQCEFGMSPNIIRLEGYGNGGNILRLTKATIDSLMGPVGVPGMAPGRMTGTQHSTTGEDRSKMNNPCIVAHPEYEENFGPINVRVIDPLKIKEGRYNLLFWNGEEGSHANDSSAVGSETRWCVVRADGGQIPTTENGRLVYRDTIWSHFTISRYNEQIFPELGIAVTLVNPTPAATDLTDPNYKINIFSNFYQGFVNDGALLNSSMTFADENMQWLSGIPDNDSYMTYNWVRSGTQFSANSKSRFVMNSTPYSISETYLDEDYFKGYQPNERYALATEAVDKNQIYEAVVGGLWAPYGLVSTLPFHPGFNFSYYMASERIFDSLGYDRYRLERRLMVASNNLSLCFNDLSQVPSVHIVLTADTSKWTRCPVIEECDDKTQSEGNAIKFSPRRHASVNKDGKTLADLQAEGAVIPATDDYNHPNYIAAEGMGWFPGYAINTVTGERLNIMFGEDSRFVQYNGRDMMWNPVQTIQDGTENYVIGGRHYIYVMNAGRQPFYNLTHAKNSNSTLQNDYNFYYTPSYDAGAWAMKMLGASERIMNHVPTQMVAGGYDVYKGVTRDATATNPMRDTLALLYASVAWVNMPLVSNRYAFDNPKDIPCDVAIDIDVRMPYGLNLSPNRTSAQIAGNAAINRNVPAYQFIINPSDAVLENLATAQDARKSYVDSILALVNVVPNPYYSYSDYETASQLETKVRIINLPTGIDENGNKAGCSIRIYTVDGTLVRTLGPTPVNTTYVDWDLHNQTGIPIAGGVYLIHVTVPGIGERVIKWFGTMRPVDLNSFGF